MSSELQPKLGSRALFPKLRARAYLNHAAISPVCTPVARAVEAALEDYQENGALAFPRAELQRRGLREQLAKLIGADISEVALGFNTTRGVTDVALALPWRAGDRVVMFEGEFPANVSPWQRAAEVFDLQLSFLPASAFETDQGLELLDRELKRGVRLVAASFVQFQSGLTMPLREIGTACRRYDAELFVDAIQGCGSVPLDVDELCIDYLSSGGHKWLLGTEGAGFLYVRNERSRALRPTTAGWLSHENAADFLFKGPGHLRYDRPLLQDAGVFETGTSSLLSLAALSASVPLLLELGVANIFAHAQAYHDALEPLLLERGFSSHRPAGADRRSAILSVRPPAPVESVPLAQGLRQHGIVAGTPDGNLRFAPHFANSLDEVPVLVDALDQVIATLR